MATRSPADHRSEYADFTEDGYRAALRLARENYDFVGYRDVTTGRHVLWRHDLDASMNRALRLAEIEREEGVKATYFLFPRCLYYNLLNPLTHTLVGSIVALGHELALHFDPQHYGPGLSRPALETAIGEEANLIAREFGVTPTAVSFHLFGALREHMPDDDLLAGLVNAYSKRLSSAYGYVSDSNGLWLHRRLHDLLAAGTYERLQVLTHPEWWTPQTMPPRLRLQRAIDGYARAMEAWYDDTVERSGRPNLRD